MKCSFASLLHGLCGLVIASLAAPSTSSAADAETRIFELRTYHAEPGKLPDLLTRFREHTVALFAKHGMTNLGYWVPVENSENELIYLLAYPNREARELAWKEFQADPDWQKAKAASEAAGKIVGKIDQLFLTATDFSPAIAPDKSPAERFFELRTYTTTSPANLTLLHARFRDHTMALFAKHGMTNLFYFALTPEQPAAPTTLVYFLAHPSVEEAKKNFDAFRADPDWIAAKVASEERGGGSLTTPDGVKSVFLKATDFSPTR